MGSAKPTNRETRLTAKKVERHVPQPPFIQNESQTNEQVI